MKWENNEEKAEKTHYLYICTKNKNWKKVYKEHFEQEIIRLIILEKNTPIDDESDKLSDNSIQIEKADQRS